MDERVGTVSHTHELFQYAQTIYSLLVCSLTFDNNLSPVLARLLRYELELIPDEDWATILTLLLWILALGGIAALGTPYCLWFARKLHLQLGTWESFRLGVRPGKAMVDAHIGAHRVN